MIGVASWILLIGISTLRMMSSRTETTTYVSSAPEHREARGADRDAAAADRRVRRPFPRPHQRHFAVFGSRSWTFLPQSLSVTLSVP
ncbi:hypothetical protein MTP03_02630 [Tsukamurella sp. PLM1]|nr:hypothetical protein MTP03_02630 [Tsukamurella sp. PLM1]